MLLGEKIRYLREVEGNLRGLNRAMTQQEMLRAIRSELGADGSKISQSYLSQIESGTVDQTTLYNWDENQLEKNQGSLVWTGTMAVANVKNDNVVTLIPLRELLKGKKPGAFVLVANDAATPKKDGDDYSQQLAITNCNLDYSGCYGINADNADGMIVKNCTISRSNNKGINTMYSNYVQVDNSTVRSTGLLAGLRKNGFIERFEPE